MKQRIHFLKEYIKNPSNTGSIIPSSKFLKKQMLSNIDFSKDFILVEYGPGNGVFSEEIATNISPNSLYLLIENNFSFFSLLNNKFKDTPNVFVFHDSVENIDIILSSLNITSVDYVISSIPFLSIGEKFTNNVFKKTKSILKHDGKFIFFQYTTILSKIVNLYFSNYNKKIVMLNIPPAIVFSANS